MLEARRKFIKAFAAASATCLYTPLAGAQSGATVVPQISLLLFEDPRFVLASATSATLTMATEIVVSSASESIFNLEVDSS